MIECTNFKSYQKGSLQGFADIFVPAWGVEIKGLSLFMKDGKRWITFPAKEYENTSGEKKFIPYINFQNKEYMYGFAKQTKEAIDKWCKENEENKTESGKSVAVEAKQ